MRAVTVIQLLLLLGFVVLSILRIRQDRRNRKLMQEIIDKLRG
jgi:preprotein translocase subunit YajC